MPGEPIPLNLTGLDIKIQGRTSRPQVPTAVGPVNGDGAEATAAASRNGREDGKGPNEAIGAPVGKNGDVKAGPEPVEPAEQPEGGVLPEDLAEAAPRLEQDERLPVAENLEVKAFVAGNNPPVDRVDDVIEAYTVNRSQILGDDQVVGLLQTELERINAELGRITDMRTSLEASSAQYGRKQGRRDVLRFFKRAERDSVAVARARAELNTTRSEVDRLQTNWNAYRRQERYTDREIDIYSSIARLQQETGAGGSRPATAAEQARIDAYSDNDRYQNYLVFENGGTFRLEGKRGKQTRISITEGRGWVGLARENNDRILNLNRETKRERTVMAGRRILEENMTPWERELQDYRAQLERVAQFVQDEYAPDQNDLRIVAAQLSSESRHRGNLDNDEQDSSHAPKQFKKAVEAERKRLEDEIPRLSRALTDLADPMRRLERSPDLARGLELMTQPGLEPKRLTYQDQFLLTTARVLLGIPPGINLDRFAPSTVAVGVSVGPRGDGRGPAEGPEPTPGADEGPTSSPAAPLGVGEAREEVPTVPPEELQRQLQAYDEIHDLLGSGFELRTTEDLLGELHERHGWQRDADADNAAYILRAKGHASRLAKEAQRLAETDAAQPRVETPTAQVGGGGIEPVSPAAPGEVPAAPAAEVAERPRYEGPPITDDMRTLLSQRIAAALEGNTGLLRDPEVAAGIRREVAKGLGWSEDTVIEIQRQLLERYDKLKEERPDQKIKRGLANSLVIAAMFTGNAQKALEIDADAEE